MSRRCTCALVLSLLVSSTAARAQSRVDPSGHWSGSLQLPAMEIGFEIDLARSAAGALTGTISIPSQHLANLPLTTLAIDGDTLTLAARTDQMMTATLASDGQSMSGEYTVHGMNVPFALTRRGEAHIVPPARGAAIRKDLEGTWTGTLDVDGGLHLVLTLASDADGASIATVVNLDEGGLTIPLVASIDGAAIRLTSPAIDGVVVATPNADATRLTGTYTQGGVSLPLTFTRAR